MCKIGRSVAFTARNAQVSITKPISRCKRIACSDLMITSLLQVVNKLAGSCELCAILMQVVSPTCRKTCLQLDEVNRLDTTCWQIASGW